MSCKVVLLFATLAVFHMWFGQQWINGVLCPSKFSGGSSLLMYCSHQAAWLQSALSIFNLLIMMLF
jgi:hypothetical protein